MICIKKWIYKITNCGEENRLYIKVYAKDHLVQKIKTYLL